MTLVEAVRTRVRTAARITAINLRGQADFRADFVAGVVLGVLWQTSVIAFAAVLLVRFPSIGSWSSPAALLAAMRLASHGLATLGFGRIVYIDVMMQKGLLDAYHPADVGLPADPLLGVQPPTRSAICWHGDGGGRPGVRPAMDGAAVCLLVDGIVGGMLVEAGVNTALSGLTIDFPFVESRSLRFQQVLGNVGNYPLNILP